MIQLYYWPTPNGYKITLFLEETGLPHEIIPIDISKGAQFEPGFLKISPNNRIPAIVDTEPLGGGEPLALFESGAILCYLAEKTGKFCPSVPRKKYETYQWLFWQMGGLGPMSGQNNHFANYAAEKLPYAIDRYVTETGRLFRVLNDRLLDREFITGEYSIADMACYPWVVIAERLSQDLTKYAALNAWVERIKARPATVRAYEKGQAIRPGRTVMDEKTRKILFGQK